MTLLGALVVSALGWGFPLPAPTQAQDASADVSRTLDAARKEIATYKTAGGASGTADHPAIKWAAALWAYREKYPRSEAAALASAEAVRLLIRAELWERAQTRVDALDADDAAWERGASAVYEMGIAQENLASTIDKLSRVVAATTNARIKSSALLVLGRAYRRQGNTDAAVRSFEASKAAAPGTPYAEDAGGLLYEIKYLSPGLPAPPITGTARSGRAVTLDGFRGKAVVLVFWGTT
jgi:tetratricopeptide (TPR) repeat protein